LVSPAAASASWPVTEAGFQRNPFHTATITEQAPLGDAPFD
jgi:hypothetical protein